MSTDRLTAIPAAIIAGDTVAITMTLSDYTSPTWAIAWTLAGPDTLSVTSTDSVPNHLLDLTSSQTSGLGAGLYQWRTRVTDGTTVTTVGSGVLTVTADLATLGAGEATPWEVTQLAVVEEALAGTLTGEMRRYMIAGRQVETFGVDELWSLRAKLKDAVARLTSGGVRAQATFGTASTASALWS